ncbi:hypothetical protein HMPREF3227_00478 [Corynebacterium sp. CMW7794]|uniref:hypothetical protein n=1 Tax=Corynebacterium TaxID=1716 RepID=UPI000797906F|nr:MULTISPECIES: hypothetical protein [Corynebacterium]KXB54634.1 hypothetical protein HMPREF0307_01380 [Corynebacterium sp. DNF00584]KXI19464.1 hypothetical protein HMPREF3227_00478 [Corynebacterium sp. CMW7794]OFL76931.1 hypothetical protein HMPREF2748_05040 [Corynebacterium sp. HMSC077B05]OFP19107.1 hypothetical protein HMPREF2998_10405 [Corynebacterium sp. HMSC065A05]OFP67957.1 hypothetical protein HMPREF2976_09540 [Corynebacterium sp. HMSC077D10]
MAEEKQLTVAELLARNKQERTGGDKPRRRRRSLEEGGVSVAELTGSLKKVEATPAQAKHSNVDIDETAPVIPAPKPEAAQSDAAQSDAAKSAPAQSEAERIEALKKAEFAKKAEEAKKKAAEKKATEDKAAASSIDEAPLDPKVEEDRRILAEKRERDAVKAASTPSTGDTTVIKKVEDEPAAQLEDAATTEIDRVDDAEDADPAEYEDAEDDGKLNPVSIILLALVGIVLGAVVYKGFEILWTNFNKGLVAALAVAVTAAMAGVVHALRTDRDKAAIVLSIIVGLVLTFGALLTA